MLQKYPEFTESKIDTTAITEIEWLKKMILAIRNIRGEMNISPTKALTLLLNKGSAADKTKITQHEQYLKTLAKLENISWLKEEKPTITATALVDELELHIDLTGLIDINAEIARLNKEINKLQSEIERIKTKLNNDNYIAKAPAAIVTKDREKVREKENILLKLQEQLKNFQGK